MSEYLFDRLVENNEFNRISLEDIRYALSNGWIDEEDAEIYAGIILDC